MLNELPYRAWHDLNPRLLEARPARESNDWRAVRQLLEPHADGTVLVQSLSSGDLDLRRVSLWTGEANALRTDRIRPRVSSFSHGFPPEADFANIVRRNAKQFGDAGYLALSVGLLMSAYSLPAVFKWVIGIPCLDAIP